MVSLKKVIYIVGTVTGDDNNKYMSFNDICTYIDIDQEGCDPVALNSRVRSQVNAYKNLFAVKRISNRRILFRLNANGKRYFNKIKDFYDPINDRLLFQPERIEVF